MLSGRPDVKYGLQLPAKAQNRPKSGPKSQEKSVLPPSLSVFGSDDDEDVEAEIARQALKKRSRREVEQQHAAALKEDASVFDYDAVYDDMKKTKDKEKFEDEPSKRQSKYIGQLLNKAKVRQQEQDIIHERMLTKERAKEDHMYGDKEKFVTRAYKEKLAEQAQWLEEEKRREALEAANDVTKKGDMGDFYRNLLHNNVAFGGKVEENIKKPQGLSHGAKVTTPPIVSSHDKAKTGKIEERSQAPRAAVREGVIDGEKERGGDKQILRGEEERRIEGDGEGDGRQAPDQPDVLNKPTGSNVGRLGEEKTEKVVVESSSERVRDESSMREKAEAARERYLARKKQRA